MEMQNKINVDETIDESNNRYLTFITAGQLFGVPIKEIVQITQMQEIIPLPEQSHYILGF